MLVTRHRLSLRLSYVLSCVPLIAKQSKWARETRETREKLSCEQRWLVDYFPFFLFYFLVFVNSFSSFRASILLIGRNYDDDDARATTTSMAKRWRRQLLWIVIVVLCYLTKHATHSSRLFSTLVLSLCGSRAISMIAVRLMTLVRANFSNKKISRVFVWRIKKKLNRPKRQRKMKIKAKRKEKLFILKSRHTNDTLNKIALFTSCDTFDSLDISIILRFVVGSTWNMWHEQWVSEQFWHE